MAAYDSFQCDRVPSACTVTWFAFISTRPCSSAVARAPVHESHWHAKMEVPRTATTRRGSANNRSTMVESSKSSRMLAIVLRSRY